VPGKWRRQNPRLIKTSPGSLAFGRLGELKTGEPSGHGFFASTSLIAWTPRQPLLQLARTSHRRNANRPCATFLAASNFQRAVALKNRGELLRREKAPLGTGLIAGKSQPVFCWIATTTLIWQCATALTLPLQQFLKRHAVGVPVTRALIRDTRRTLAGWLMAGLKPTKTIGQPYIALACALRQQHKKEAKAANP